MALDLSEFETLNKPRRMKCGVGVVLAALAPDDAAKLQGALDREDIGHAAVALWLAKREIKMAGQTIGRHRNHQCSCG